MPYTKENAVKASKKGVAARWGNKDPATVRNRQVKITVTQSELDMMDDKAAEADLPRVELIVRAVRDYEPEKKEGVSP